MKKILMILVAMLTAVPCFAIDYWTIGKVQAVLVGGEESAEAGMVFVSATAVEDASGIAAVNATMQTDPVVLSGAAGASAINKEYYFYAKANAGYNFLGFASTATGNPSGTGLVANMTQVGDYYSYAAKAGAGWSANTEETAKVFTRYAVFEKVEGEGDGGDDDKNDGDKDTATVARVTSVTNQSDKNLVDAVLKVNDGENFEDGDIVTHIYVTFDHELADISSMSAHKALAQAVSIVNITTGKTLEFNQYSCGVKSGDKHVLDLFLSSDSYINSSTYQGVYTVTLPAGVAKSTNDLPTEAYTFSFTYGNPDGEVDEIVLDDYVGHYTNATSAEEKGADEVTFDLEKDGEGYVVKNLCNSTLQIPLVVNGKSYSLAATSNEAYTFGSAQNGDVPVRFEENEGQMVIYIEDFDVKNIATGQTVTSGLCYFVMSDATAISAVKVSSTGVVFDLQGRRQSTPAKGMNIINGKKYIVK